MHQKGNQIRVPAGIRGLYFRHSEQAVYGRERQMEFTKVSSGDYERQTAATRDERMQWFRDARFGMFVHYGLLFSHGPS